MASSCVKFAKLDWECLQWGPKTLAVSVVVQMVSGEVAGTVDSSGDIETFTQTDPVRAGDTVKLVFRAEDEASPPFNIRVRSPSGQIILERVLRELPTGQPQSAPPVQFAVSAAGDYKIEVWQLYGKQRGDAVLHVT